ncbi:peptidase domain-containing ABC transporter [Sediminicola luteus]|uniref:ABC transporter ATP-binding protein/permease n=1 Tax=Sediminicola luteus TaxID=319238 RepID=A0A2A4G9X8_9FLAO|nr:ATP-binding cassette domain-containing protein [Sediminicola luteus]PCE64778.1 ABC transporter ATP-binding protein/permease [Sediminicola luteus]
MEQKQMTPLQRLIGLLQPDKREIKQIIFYAVFAGLVALSVPLGVQAIINLIQGAQISTSWIVLVVMVTLGVGFQGALQLMQIRILENVQQKIFMRSSFEFAYRFPKIKMSELRNYYPPELANRFFDTLTVQKSLPKLLLDFPAAILQIFFGITLLSFYHPFFILYGLLLILLIYVVFKFTAERGLETSLQESKSKYKVAHWIQEVARSLVSFKLSGKTQLAMQSNDRLTTDYLKARESHFKVLFLQFMQMIGFKVLVTAGLLLVGGLLVLNQQMNIGQFVAAEIVILLVIASVEKLVTGLETVYDMLTSLEKIGQVVDKELEPQSGLNPWDSQTDLLLEVENLNFNTPQGRPLFSDVFLHIKHGDRILLQGKSGSGKSTLLKLLSGLLEPSQGGVYVNNTSLQALRPNAYRMGIGQVLPEQLPFEGSILENITFGNTEIGQERVFEVLRQLELTEFIKEQPKGIHTILYPEGQHIPTTISKRILLARAIINNPCLLLLKEPLEHFEPAMAKQLAGYLTHPDRPWALVVSGGSPIWEKLCGQVYEIKDKRLIKK